LERLTDHGTGARRWPALQYALAEILRHVDKLLIVNTERR
jgi:hypothetical protein